MHLIAVAEQMRQRALSLRDALARLLNTERPAARKNAKQTTEPMSALTFDDMWPEGTNHK